mgnify:CR=1 FL=1
MSKKRVYGVVAAIGLVLVFAGIGLGVMLRGGGSENSGKDRELQQASGGTPSEVIKPGGNGQQDPPRDKEKGENLQGDLAAQEPGAKNDQDSEVIVRPEASGEVQAGKKPEQPEQQEEVKPEKPEGPGPSEGGTVIELPFVPAK